MPKLEDQIDFAIGVDTHKDTHTAAIVDARGAVIISRQIAVGLAGYAELLKMAEQHAAGRRLWAIEGTCGYGRGLNSFLGAHCERTTEIARPKRHARCAGGRSDEGDAIRAAREVFRREHPAEPRRDGDREAVRVLLSTRRACVSQRTRQINQMHAAIVSAPHELRDKLAGLRGKALVDRCKRLRASSGNAERNATVMCLRTHATVITTYTDQIRSLEAEIKVLVERLVPELTDILGVGPVCAAQLVCSYSHHGRIRNEAAFAMLAGTSPIQASSGKVQRHRLNRRGDRQLNCAFHRIAVTRMKHDPETKAYVARRTQEGKSHAEIRRCVKRALTRRLFRTLQAIPSLA